MSGRGNSRILVDCAACDGSGKRKSVARDFSVVVTVCEICRGKKKISVPRKTVPAVDAGTLNPEAGKRMDGPC